MYTDTQYAAYDHINDAAYSVVDFGCGGDAERWVPNSIRIDCDYSTDADIHYDSIDALPRACCNIITATHVLHYFALQTFTDVLHDFARIVVPGGKCFITCYNMIWHDGADKEVYTTPHQLLETYKRACDDHHEWEIECFAIEYTDRPDPDMQEYIVHLNRLNTPQ
jgi:hypothetical protein